MDLETIAKEMAKNLNENTYSVGLCLSDSKILSKMGYFPQGIRRFIEKRYNMEEVLFPTISYLEANPGEFKTINELCNQINVDRKNVLGRLMMDLINDSIWDLNFSVIQRSQKRKGVKKSSYMHCPQYAELIKKLKNDEERNEIEKQFLNPDNEDMIKKLFEINKETWFNKKIKVLSIDQLFSVSKKYLENTGYSISFKSTDYQDFIDGLAENVS